MINSKDPIRVLVVSSSDKVFDFFHSLLSEKLFSDVQRATSIGEAKRIMVSYPFDIVIINAPLKDETGIEFAIDLSSDTSTGVMILISNEYYEQISDEAGGYGILTVSRPNSKQILYECVRLLAATNARLRNFEKKNAKLTAKMEEIRIVNHAKWVLIENLGISEDDAHKIIEKQAMDSRQAKREIAEVIIKTYQN